MPKAKRLLIEIEALLQQVETFERHLKEGYKKAELEDMGKKFGQHYVVSIVADDLRRTVDMCRWIVG